MLALLSLLTLLTLLILVAKWHISLHLFVLFGELAHYRYIKTFIMELKGMGWYGCYGVIESTSAEYVSCRSLTKDK